jgi:GAF domain-containing protein
VSSAVDRIAEAVPGPAGTLGGARSFVCVPMLKDDALIGAIAIYRQEVRPFTDKQIALVENFAAQAVIAIENTRLLNELRQRTTDLGEALEQQTATSEVLRVISSSPGDLGPVFQAMLENATRICEAKFGVMQLSESDGLRAVALHDVPPAYAEAMRRNPVFRPVVGHPLDRVASTKRVVHILDARAEQRMRGWMVELAGARTLLLVPMLKDNELVGVISIYRQEVRPFTDKQIALVQNFAAQAVIAIENARLLNELRESLEQQTATADVLRVISASPGDLEPVFDMILDNALEICEANMGDVFRIEGNAARIVGTRGALPEYATFRRDQPPYVPAPDTPLSAVIHSREPVHVADMRELPGYAARLPNITAAIELNRVRTQLVVPMMRDDLVIGVIMIFRREVRSFEQKHIELVKNFAAQAVIAIENARLLSELRESLEQQTATSEVLKVISSSPGELEPVFQTILDKAVHICEANFGTLFRLDGENLYPMAQFNPPAAYFDALTRRGPFKPIPAPKSIMLCGQSRRSTLLTRPLNLFPASLNLFLAWQQSSAARDRWSPCQ